MKLSAIPAAGICVVAVAAMASIAQAQEKKAQAQPKDMTFFVTSVGKGNGADLGGLEGADAHRNALAKAAGSKHSN